MKIWSIEDRLVTPRFVAEVPVVCFCNVAVIETGMRDWDFTRKRRTILTILDGVGDVLAALPGGECSVSAWGLDTQYPEVPRLTNLFGIPEDRYF